MKIRISDTLIINSNNLLSVELDGNAIVVIFNDNLKLREYYNNELESNHIFNNIISYINVKDIRFYKGDKPREEDERKAKAFDMFWNLYDKKVDFARCEKAFLNLTLEQMGKAVKSVKNYVESTPDKKYRKNPLTWINNRGWESEVKFDKKKVNRYVKPKYVTDER